MERKFTFAPEHFYHVYNRGVEKRSIFADDSDKRRFQHLLHLANGSRSISFKQIRGEPLEWEPGERLTSIVAYALMTNHFHAVLYEKTPGGISAFMGKLSTAYSMYFNIKNDRSGTLLCRPFRAQFIDNDDYFRWVISYVHLNPLDLVEPGWKEKRIRRFEEAVRFLATYPYSSYQDYFGQKRRESRIIDKTVAPIDIAQIETIEEMLKDYRDIPERPSLEIW